MKAVYLIHLTAQNRSDETIERWFREFKRTRHYSAYEDGFLWPVSLFYAANFREFKNSLIYESTQLNRKPNRRDKYDMPAYALFAIYNENHKLIGIARLRRELTEKAYTTGAGHLSLGIFAEYRNQGYGRLAMQRLLTRAPYYCRADLWTDPNLDQSQPSRRFPWRSAKVGAPSRLLLSCHETNASAERIIASCGATPFCTEPHMEYGHIRMVKKFWLPTPTPNMS